MIAGFIGSQGSGKTMCCVYFMQLDLLEGKRVITNIDLPEWKGKPNYYFVESLKQLVEMEKYNSMIVIDEVTLWGLDNRASSSKEGKMLTTELIFQCRKQRIKLFYTAQMLSIDKRLREQTDVYFECEKCIMEDGKLRKIISNIEISPDIEVFIKVDMLHVTGEKTNSFYFRANDFFKKYDTQQLQKTQYTLKGDKKC